MCKFLRNTFLLFTLKYWFAMIDVVVKQFSSLRKERKRMFNKIKNQENISENENGEEERLKENIKKNIIKTSKK